MSTSLSASELRYRRLFESARDGILILDPVTGRIIDVNPFLIELLGYSFDEFIGRELYEIGLHRDAEASRDAFDEILAKGYIRYDDLPLRTKAGKVANVEFVSNLYREGARFVIQCNVRDITERKKAETALRLADEQLARHAIELENQVKARTLELRLAHEQLERFVYSIAHDLRAPLRSMQGFAQLLAEDHVWKLDQQGRAYTRIISTAAQAMDRLLVDLLTFSRMSPQESKLIPVGLAGIVQGAVAICEAEFGGCAAHIESEHPWPAVLAHPHALSQVLATFIGNAMRNLDEQPTKVLLHPEERSGGIIRIWVEDRTPPGVERSESPFEHASLFGPFNQSGTDFGLSVVQKIVARMGGQIGIELPKAQAA